MLDWDLKKVGGKGEHYEAMTVISPYLYVKLSRVWGSNLVGLDVGPEFYPESGSGVEH